MFDAVLGNPPYARVQSFSEKQREQVRNTFRTARGSYDMSVLFAELAGYICNHAGLISLIMPHKFLNTASSSGLRNCLENGSANGLSLAKMIHFGASQLFKGFDTYICIVLFDKARRKSFQFQRIPYFKGEFSQNIDDAKFREISISEIQELYRLYGNKENNWILLNTERDLKILSKILSQKTAVRDIAHKFMQGIATSCDDLYFAEVIRENPDSFDLKFNYPAGSKTVITGMEKRYFKRLLKGRDVHRYEELKSNTCVFFPYNIDKSAHPCKAELARIEELKRYPKTYEYVMRFKSDFENREKGSLKEAPDFYKYIYPKNLCDFEQEKLMSMEICACGEANFAIDRNGFYCTSTVYSLVKKSDCKYSYECLLGILNSSLFWWFLRHTGDVLAENTRRVKTNYIYPFRLPEWSQEFDDTVSSLVRQRIRGDKDAERQIDLLITKAYGLSRDEACIVRPGLKSCYRDAENLLASANKS